MKKILLLILKFYQRLLTLFSFGSCRYHPTCSEYAKWQFENNNIFLAFYYSFIRILRCNQLFNGGLDYPKVKVKFKRNKCKFKKINVKYWYIPYKKDNYLIIKNWKWKNGNK